MHSNNEFNKGVLFASLGSFWWGFLGVIYFKYISFVGHIEILIHRCIWTTFFLTISTLLFYRIKDIKLIFGSKIKLIYLLFSGILIFVNWGVWIYAVGNEQIIDASFGYFIMPIISVFFGFFFFKEKLTKKGKISISIVVSSIIALFIYDIKSIPWVGLIVAFSWSFYNLIRKKIEIPADIGLLIESLFLFPFVLVAFYFLIENNYNDFSLSNPQLSLLILLSGPMTVIPLYLYIRGVKMCGLGATGMIFYITPSLQFILGYLIYNEPLNLQKLVSFIFIWFAVFIYLRDLYENI
tara:strand:- start:293 stop:1177 length:885 start_codon:yes stop_codon:yes gene_type:complete